ncbi:hypothetical protein GCM10010435_45060 [Winogradskya consettensis]|uniref:Lipoprotein n=1 Tax=Winogradskya consettensis TaxID=113560 RepID=A0A919VWL9_9ACTN|nr:hypothetical protein [Actinoplanes consettensis]GIM82823.1 hypothetical protein Aco04nite_83450 [Actinoplanes consettensis]
MGTRTAAALTAITLSGCAAATPPSAALPSTTPARPSTTPALPSTTPALPFNSVPTGPPPGLTKPVKPPKTPTDVIQSPGWTEGYVLRGGSGPCYGLLDMDGFPYAMYSDTGTALKKGDHVRVRVVPATLRIYCGEGTPVRMEAVEHVS